MSYRYLDAFDKILWGLSMSVPRNYYLKGVVDDSKPGFIETLYLRGILNEPEVLASHTLNPEEVRTIVERLYWTSIDGRADYNLGEQSDEVILSYSFSSFWNAITDSFSIAQYSEDYSIKLRMDLMKKLRMEELKFPHLVKIRLAMHSLGDEFSKVKIPSHDGKFDSFECRAEIIAHATYIQGMLYKIIDDSRKATPKPLGELTYHEMIKFCADNVLLDKKLLSLVRRLTDLRNDAAHQFSFGKVSGGDDCLSVEPVSTKLMDGIEIFVASCERRYKLKAGRINRFRNSVRVLAGEINKDAKLAMHIVLGKQYPSQLSTYFYG
ncbi:hypothetical protein [Pseudomonas eucalypticola]|uniref:Uncharacterized protein n=1 Tax=Pseudomonas eucalypticola TaxID=2599595 RepID=A0A7D5D8A5_9PSED|nr:hypothetical protein [Pseudomonas eucalypticola]QKZ06054.1 hypothetical protein HWQ56_20605 [Pseudomonas eucalypticola]